MRQRPLKQIRLRRRKGRNSSYQPDAFDDENRLDLDDIATAAETAIEAFSFRDALPSILVSFPKASVIRRPCRLRYMTATGRLSFASRPAIGYVVMGFSDMTQSK